MTINQDEIDAIKKGVDLVLFMQACGIELKQVGGNYRGHCLFHEDSSPSLTVNPRENLWNCFGCDKGGDNIRFVQLFDRISFNEAVNFKKESSKYLTLFRNFPRHMANADIGKIYKRRHGQASRKVWRRGCNAHLLGEKDTLINPAPLNKALSNWHEFLATEPVEEEC